MRFEDEEWDSPSEPGPYGNAGWTEGDKAFLVYDRYDIWEIAPDGPKARMLTNGLGRKEEIVFRYSRLEPDESRSSRPGLSFSRQPTTSPRPRAHYRVDPAKTAADPVKVVMLDKQFGGLQKAKNAEVYVHTEQRFEEFPDLWVSGPDFTAARKVSSANPQQAEYNWGRAELIDYTNADGVKLPAILIKPGGLRPLEKISPDGLHLRDAGLRPPSLLRPLAGDQHQQQPLRQQRLCRPACPTSSTRSAIPARAP